MHTQACVYISDTCLCPTPGVRLCVMKGKSEIILSYPFCVILTIRRPWALNIEDGDSSPGERIVL